MQNPAIQSLSEEQQAMVQSIPQPLPNPDLLPSPYLWSPQYISPAFDNYNSLKSALSNQVGFGYYDSVSNQFNSALTQPIGEQPTQLGGRSINTDQIKHWELQKGGMFGPGQPEFNNPIWTLYDDARSKTDNIPIINKIGIKAPKLGKFGRGKKKK